MARPLLATLLAVATLGLVPAGAAPGAPVSVDVLVTDGRGRLVSDLQPGEIDVHEDGVPRGVADLKSGGLEGPRLFGIFLDEYHVDAAATDRVRAAVRAFLDQELAPGDRASVLRPLDSLVSIGFTDERSVLDTAVGVFEGRRGDFRARSAFERNFLARSPAVVERTRAQVSWSALMALADALGRSSDGRKTLLVVSQGIGASGQNRGPRVPGRETVARIANRGRVAVYVLDPSTGEPGPESATGEDAAALATLAEETSGRTSRGDLRAGLAAAAADASGYYWLSYDPSHEDDGRFHRVSVSVRRPQATVRARRGYWARSAAVERLIARAGEASTPPPSPLAEGYHASPLITPWFGFARGANGSTRVTFVWEPSPRAVGRVAGRPRTASPVPSRLGVEVFGPDDRPIFTGEVAPALPSVEPGPDEAVQAVFDAPPGRVRLKMSVKGGPAGEELDRDVRAITIRRLDGPVSMGSPSVVRTFNALEWRRVVDDPAAPPSAAREFRRTERLLIRIPVYADGPVGVSARLLGPGKTALRDLDAAAGPGDGSYQIDLPLASFAQGEYAVEIVASGPAGEARDTLSFRVSY